ncbi:11850_t:CDS:2 [Diversispora eburnea]|uniref:11850_t:CDS:1 n=1 Tax=Diversispora eburnea TaxID=1213867 RepID=A0A9N8ZYE1_9GLOM|nr:11850_t:CDS:2 [Diversispora eburnea]
MDISTTDDDCISYYATPPSSPMSRPFDDLDDLVNPMILNHNNNDLDTMLASMSTISNNGIFRNNSSVMSGTNVLNNNDDAFDFFQHNSSSHYPSSLRKNNITDSATITANDLIQFEEKKRIEKIGGTLNLNEINKMKNSPPPISQLQLQPRKQYPRIAKNLIKIDITHITFEYINGKPLVNLPAQHSGDLAFLNKTYNDNNTFNDIGDISICFNNMSNEALIPIDQLCGFKIGNDGKIFLRLKPDFEVIHHLHLGGYPYLLDPTILDNDPTSDGKFNQLISVILIPYNPTRDFSKLSDIESKIERVWFRTQGIRNELQKEGQKMYLTCVFPTERRAMAIPTDSPFHRLCLDLESRFELDSNNLNLRFRNKNGELIGLMDENSWKLARSEATGKSLIRLEIHIW